MFSHFMLSEQGVVFKSKNAPKWVEDAVRGAHGQMLPNSFVYEVCEAAADYLDDLTSSDDILSVTETPDHALIVADIIADRYQSRGYVALGEWLTTYPGAFGVCDSAIVDSGLECFTVAECITAGLYSEAYNTALAFMMAVPDDVYVEEARRRT